MAVTRWNQESLAETLSDGRDIESRRENLDRLRLLLATCFQPKVELALEMSLKNLLEDARSQTSPNGEVHRLAGKLLELEKHRSESSEIDQVSHVETIQELSLVLLKRLEEDRQFIAKWNPIPFLSVQGVDHQLLEPVEELIRVIERDDFWPNELLKRIGDVYNAWPAARRTNLEAAQALLIILNRAKTRLEQSYTIGLRSLLLLIPILVILIAIDASIVIFGLILTSFGLAIGAGAHSIQLVNHRRAELEKMRESLISRLEGDSSKRELDVNQPKILPPGDPDK